MTTLETLLMQLRDGPPDPSALARARALLVGDARIPEDVREIALTDPAEATEDAVGLLAVLGLDELGLGLADALREELEAPADPDLDDEWAPIGLALRDGLVAEAAGVEVAGAVLRRLRLADFAWGPVLADAVQAEAGVFDVADAVLAAVGGAEAPVAAAVRAEAGEIDGIELTVARALELEVLPVREALLAEAGTAPDVTDAVMDRIGAADAMRAAAKSMPAGGAAPSRSSVGAPVDVPPPANDGWGFRQLRRWGVGLAVAAAALLSVVVAWQSTGGSDESLVFAQAGDVVIEDLSTGDNVSVVQLEGDDGAVILWVDEEA